MNGYPLFWMSGVVELNNTERKIRAFAKFEPGWRLGSGKPFSKSVLNAACKINRKAVDSGFLKTDAFPGRNGDISVVLYDDKDCYEFSIRDASIVFTHEKSNEDDEEGPALTLQNSLELIPRLKEEKWNTFSICTSAIMTGSLGGFVQLPCQNQVMEVEYQSYPVNVYWPPQDVFVPMQSDITQTLPTHLQCSGNSGRLNYLRGANWSHRKGTTGDDCHVNLKKAGKQAKKLIRSLTATDFKVCAPEGIRTLTKKDAEESSARYNASLTP